MKQLLLLFTLLLMISTEAIGQRSYHSSYRSSFRSYSRPSYSRPSYTKTTYSKPAYVKPNYVKPKYIANVYKAPVKTVKIDGTKTITQPINKSIITKPASINNKQAYSSQYNDRSKTYIYRDNSISWSNLALMYYVIRHNNHTHRSDTLRAKTKPELEKKVDTWTTNQK